MTTRRRFDQAELVETKGQGPGADRQLLSDYADVLVALEPQALHDSLRHEQAGSEVVGHSLGLLLGGLEGSVVVEEIFGRVVENVLELMHQAEPLTNFGFTSVDGDDPVAPVPVCGA